MQYLNRQNFFNEIQELKGTLFKNGFNSIQEITHKKELPTR